MDSELNSTYTALHADFLKRNREFNRLARNDLLKKFGKSAAVYCIGLAGMLAIVLALSGCANKEDTETLKDILTIPFRIIGM